MINRLFVKELLLFKSVDLEFEDGLIVITGPSGAGKSVLINSLLANFGLANQEAKLCEVELKKPSNLTSQEFDLEDEIVIKALKKDRVRYFIDGQNISKKALKSLFDGFISYISVRDKSGFENERLIGLVDNFIIKDNPKYKDILDTFSKDFKELIAKEQELKEIQDRIKEANERVEFLKFEINKIEQLNPKNGEYEELLKVKKQLSKIDKITEIANKAEDIFKFEDLVYDIFNMLDKDSSYFSDAMNQLRSDFEDIQSLSEELSDIDIESVLNRLEELSSLIKRFGSIDEALEYLRQRKEELASFETIEEDVATLSAEIKKMRTNLEKLAQEISKSRIKASKLIENELEGFLKELKLPKVTFEFEKTKLYEYGLDTISIAMGSTKVESLSGGEFNRVRLALLTVAASGIKGSGVIILDEIDANVSGDESIAIANMISKLSNSFQIFAISHQPHLSSKANEHILVTKDSNTSYAKKLEGQERVEEIARIVGGENFNKEALEFAKRLF